MSYKSDFHIPEGVYLLSHSVGCLPKAVQTSLTEQYLAPWQYKGGDAWPDWLATIDLFCGQLAGLFGGTAAEYCPQTNLSAAFHRYLMALPADPARNVILMHEDAFPSMGFVVQGLARQGFETRFVKGTSLDEWADAMTSDVLAALITHVHSNTGYLSPVKQIVALCNERNIFSVVDIAQSAGIIPLSVEGWQASCVLGSCVKWLCGGPGAGFMWVNPRDIDQLIPQDIGWFSHTNPFEFDIHHFQAASDSKKFWGGTPSIAPYACATGALKHISSLGVENIRNHNLKLIQTALEGIENVSLPDMRQNGGTLCLEFPNANDIAAKLTQHNCQFDQRENTLRLSLHIYNTIEDAQLLNEILKTP